MNVLIILKHFLFQCLWIFSLVNYTPPTYNNGDYNYPLWAHGLGWSFTAASLICIPAYAIVAIVRSEGDTLYEVILNLFITSNSGLTIKIMPFFFLHFQKFKNSIRPNIYECKICGEHHCEHDTPDFQSVQEMQAIYQPKNNIVIQPADAIHRAPKNVVINNRTN